MQTSSEKSTGNFDCITITSRVNHQRRPSLLTIPSSSERPSPASSQCGSVDPPFSTIHPQKSWFSRLRFKNTSSSRTAFIIWRRNTLELSPLQSIARCLLFSYCVACIILFSFVCLRSLRNNHTSISQSEFHLRNALLD